MHIGRMAADPSRLDALEQVMARLQAELSNARRELAALRAATAPSHAGSALAPDPKPEPSGTTAGTETPRPAPAAERPRRPAAAPRRSIDIEQLAGRYGAIALAVVLIVMAAGALVSWAIAHGLLGPWVRVALGALLAVSLAAAGWRLRTHGSRQFGDVLLAIALAVVHVVAWGAGPRLALVPSWVALAVADAASVALAALALREQQQLLFCVGFGGALIAPFVTATGDPHFAVLAAYGVVLLGAAIGAIGPRAWWTAAGLVMGGLLVYALSVRGYRGDTAWINREFTAGFAGLVALIALARERKPVRPWIALLAVTVMAVFVPSSREGAAGSTPLHALVAAPDVPMVALAGTAMVFAAAHGLEQQSQFAVWVIAVALLPSVFLGAALGATGPVGGTVSGGLALAWATAWAIAALAERERKRGILLAGSGLLSMWAVMQVFHGSPSLIPPLLAAHALLYAFVSKREQAPIALVATGMSLVVAFMTAATRIAGLPPYTMTPFLSIWSLGAASAVAGVFLSARVALPDRLRLEGTEFAREQLSVLATAVPAFIWGHFELQRAVSAQVAPFLLTAYYAACGVVASRAGRRSGHGLLRQVGIAVVVAGFLIIAAHIALQPGYSTAPFLSLWSLGAAIAVVASFEAMRAGLPEQVSVLDDTLARDRAALVGAAALTFAWGHLELRRAFGPDASTFLLISYYAACGVIAIRSGRVGGERRLRQAGLVLALFAAVYALERAWSVQQIALRVGSYLFVGLFLLGVGWLYRAAGAIAAPATTAVDG